MPDEDPIKILMQNGIKIHYLVTLLNVFAEDECDEDDDEDDSFDLLNALFGFEDEDE